MMRPQTRVWRVNARIVRVVVVAGLVAALLVGCGGGDAGEDAGPDAGGTLRVAVTGTIGVDPALAIDRRDLAVADLTADSLTSIEPHTGLAAADLAESWEANADQTEFTFTFADDLTFSDGSPLVAGDVVASLQRVADPATASPVATILAPVAGYAETSMGAGPLAGLTAPDETTVVVTLGEPMADFPAVLAHPALGVVRPDDPTVGSGVFALDEIRDDGVTLTALAADTSDTDPDTSDGDTGDDSGGGGVSGRIAWVDEIRFDTYESVGLAASAVVDEEADLALLVGPDGVEVTIAGGSVEHREPVLAVSYYAMNVAHPALADARFREAITLAVDPDVVVETGYGEFADVAVGVAPPVLAGALDGCGDFCAPDPERVADLLAEVFGDAIPNTVPIHHDDTEVQARVAAEIARQLEDAGIPVEVTALAPEEYDAFLVNGEPGLFRSGWVSDTATVAAFLDPAFVPGATENVTRVAVPTLVEDLATAAATANPTERATAYEAAQEKVLGQWVAVPIAQFVTRWLAAPTVEDLRLTPFGTFDGTTVWLSMRS